MKSFSWLANRFQKRILARKRIRSRRVMDGRLTESRIVEGLELRRLLSIAAVGFETRVNTYLPDNQSWSKTAMDGIGDFVVVWQSEGQDGSGYGIYAQRYSAAGVAAGAEFRVNSYTTGNQQLPAVAMDSSGAFVVVWESAAQDQSGYGIYAQRYSATGAAQGSEFQVNTYTTGNQRISSVAMDAAGDFVIAWTSNGEDLSDYGIYAQVYNAAGIAQGNEFRVNTYTTSFQEGPSVAMDAAGDFVIAWNSFGEDLSQYGVYAQRFTSNGAPEGAEFRVNTYTTDIQKAANVAMDSVGDFVVTWESNLEDKSSYGIYAQRYASNGNAVGGEFLVNSYTTGTQGYPSIAMDSTGDFVVTWASPGSDDPSTYSVYGQYFLKSGAQDGSEFRVNTYTRGFQYLPSVAMDQAGDFVCAWESGDNQDGSDYGIYAQRYVTTVGPVVTGVLNGGPSFDEETDMLQNGERLTSPVSAISVEFSEDVPLAFIPSFWQLTRYGVDISNQISLIDYSYNPILIRYVATLNFNVPLRDGGFQLVARQTLEDDAELPLINDVDGVVRGEFRLNFYVSTFDRSGPVTLTNTYTTNQQDWPAIATDAAGDYVETWESDGEDGSGYGIYAQRYNSTGIAQGAEFQVNTITTGNQATPAIAMDRAGDFVIAWGSEQVDGSGFGVEAQRYNASGVAQGGEFPVNTFTLNNQELPAVAMDASGNFTIAWESVNQINIFSGYDVFARRYNAAGVPLGTEFQVNTYTTSVQGVPSIAMDPAGDFVIAWESYNEDGSNYGIYGQRFNATGVPQGGEFKINTTTTGFQKFPAVAMDAEGDFVVVWEGEASSSTAVIDGQRFDSAGFPLGTEFDSFGEFNIYGLGKPDSVAMDAAGDFVVGGQFGLGGSTEDIGVNNDDASFVPMTLDGFGNYDNLILNEPTSFNLHPSAPVVAMDSEGDFVIAWQSYGEEGGGSKYGIYTQRFQTDVAPYIYQSDISALNVAASLSTPIDPTISAFDQDNNNWSGATIQISTNYQSGQDVLGFTNTATPKITGSWNATTGILTLSGTDTVSDYRTALRNVTYHNTSATPNTSLTRTVDFQVTDGLELSDVISQDVIVSASSVPAVLSGVSGTGTYDENDPAIILGGSLVVTDAETNYLESATVSFTNWQAEDRVTFNNIFALQHSLTQNLTTHTASLTITGTDTLYDYQTLLRSVEYWDVSDNPVTSPRVATFTVNDGSSSSNGVTRTIAVVAINDPPLLSAIETAPLGYKANDPAFPPQTISSTLLVGDPDSSNLIKATVQITGGYENNANGHDVLSFVNQLGISGSFNATTGTLTLTGTSGVGNYRTALRSVTFSSSGANVSSANRTLTIIATDDSGTATATSLPVTRTVTVLTTNTPPALTGVPGTALAYVRGSAAAVIAPNLAVLDSDSINLMGATIQVSGNYQNGQDLLSVTNGSGITGTFSASTGTLTLSGLASLANYQAVLRTVTYKTNSSTASTATRTITFIANDGLAPSSAVSRTITLS